MFLNKFKVYRVKESRLCLPSLPKSKKDRKKLFFSVRHLSLLYIHAEHAEVNSKNSSKNGSFSENTTLLSLLLALEQR